VNLLGFLVEYLYLPVGLVALHPVSCLFSIPLFLPSVSPSPCPLLPNEFVGSFFLSLEEVLSLSFPVRFSLAKSDQISFFLLSVGFLWSRGD